MPYGVYIYNITTTCICIYKYIEFHAWGEVAGLLRCVASDIQHHKNQDNPKDPRDRT